jgi:hypothetical protein
MLPVVKFGLVYATNAMAINAPLNLKRPSFIMPLSALSHRAVRVLMIVPNRHAKP